MSLQSNIKKNEWAERIVSQWRKKNQFKFWENLSSFQRKVLINDMIYHLKSMFDMGRASIIEDIKKMGNCVQLEYSGRGQMRKFYDYIYKEASVFIERKKLKFESIINYIKNENSRLG